MAFVLAPYEARAPSRLGRLVTSTTILLALLSATTAPAVHAQEEHPPIYAWAETDTVELSRSGMVGDTGMRSLELTIREGESATYYLRLSEQPVASGWWVRVHVDGFVRYDGVLEEKGIRWVPSVGWEFRTDGSTNPTQWRSVRITSRDDNVPEDDEIVNITHEVWDQNSSCPPSLHGIAPVTVRIIDNDVASTNVQLQAQPSSVTEDAGERQVAVTATLNGAPREQDTDVSVRVVNRTAAAPADFAPVDPFTITIPEGQTSATESFPFEPVDDELVEGDESVAITGSAGGLSVTEATLTITDNDTDDTNPPDDQPARPTTGMVTATRRGW